VAEIVLGEADCGSAVRAKVGDHIVIKVGETPTSGYRWAMEAPGVEQLALESSEFQPGPSEMRGAAGTRIMTWTARSPGESTLTLNLQRSWGNAPAAEKYQIHLSAD